MLVAVHEMADNLFHVFDSHAWLDEGRQGKDVGVREITFGQHMVKDVVIGHALLVVIACVGDKKRGLKERAVQVKSIFFVIFD